MLIAMPSLREGPFARSVVYMCAHREDGAMGIVINQRAEEIDFSELLVQLDIVRKDEAIRLPRTVEQIQVLRGGPVDTGRGFVLHSSDYDGGDSTVRIAEGVSLTATLDILRAIAKGAGPRRAALALGCAGWASGQLESEILANAWLVGAVDPVADLRHRLRRANTTARLPRSASTPRRFRPTRATPDHADALDTLPGVTS